MRSPFYQDIAHDDNLVASEVHARLTGMKGAELLKVANGEKSLVSRLQKWGKHFWSFVRGRVAEEQENVALEDFVNAPLSDLIVARKLNLAKGKSTEHRGGDFMEIKKGDFIPTGWSSWSKEGAEVMGFAHHQGITIEDQIICRLHDEKLHMYEWAVGTNPSVSADGSKVVWERGDYFPTPDNVDWPPHETGVKHDTRECIAIPGRLNSAFPDLMNVPERRQEAMDNFVDFLVKNGKSVDDINNLFSGIKMRAVTRAEQQVKARGEAVEHGKEH